MTLMSVTNARKNLYKLIEEVNNSSTPVTITNSKEFKNCRELHIKPDWLLVYKYSNDNVILYLIRTGSHSDLF